MCVNTTGQLDLNVAQLFNFCVAFMHLTSEIALGHISILCTSLFQGSDVPTHIWSLVLFQDHWNNLGVFFLKLPLA